MTSPSAPSAQTPLLIQEGKRLSGIWPETPVAGFSPRIASDAERRTGMAGLRYPELILTSQPDTLELGTIDSQISTIDALIAAVPDDNDAGGLSAQQELLQIKRAETTAHTLFNQKKYSEALAAYKATLAR